MLSSSKSPSSAEQRKILLGPGPGWGDGSHPTTRLCLQAIEHLGRGCETALDFGSGSGMLSIALAKLGAQVDAVEIDPAAIEHAKQNAELNGVPVSIRYFGSLADTDFTNYSLVVANILRPVLLEFAEALTQRLGPGGVFILSGLVATDVPELAVRYSALLASQPQIYSHGDWRAMVWNGDARR